MKRKRVPLEGVLCAVTVSAEHRTVKEGPTFAGIVKRATDLGATYSATVHRRVALLLATPEAVAARTQRVRKALKLGTPIVSVDFLRACAKARVPHGPYELAIPDVPDDPPSQKKKNNNKKVITAVSPSQSRRPVPVDLGCCCSCHDSGAPSCAWCADAHAPAAPSSR